MNNWPFGDLRPLYYNLVSVDPPWTFKTHSDKGLEKSPQAHYACMDLDAIKALPIGHLCRGDAWLFLWTCAPMLDQAFQCLDAWGFRYASRLTWRKVTVNGKPRLGPGYVVRSLSEDCLIAKIGTPYYSHALPSLFDGIAREHSRKPSEFYSLVEDFAPDAWRADIFGRQSREGWRVWGAEATKFDGSLSLSGGAHG